MMAEKPTYEELETRILELEQVKSERKNTGQWKTLNIRILDRINKSEVWKDCIEEILGEIKRFSGFEAVALRLTENEDFPYYVTKGFPEHFVEAERYLCTRDIKGEIKRDSKGNPYVECMCGNVICGRTDASKGFFTENGSFWSNSTSKLLSETTDEDRQIRTRNRCNSEGYESVALFPLKAGHEILGLLQINDRRINQFTDDAIKFFEDIGVSIGTAFSRKRTKEALRQSEEKYRSIFENAVEGFFQSTPEGRFTNVNPAFAKMFGYTSPEELISNISDIAKQYYVDNEGRRRHIQLLRKTGFIEHFEFKARCKDGSHTWVSSSTRVIYDRDGKIARYEGNVTDITERKRTEVINKTLFAISNAVNTAPNINNLYRSIHNSLANIMDVTNFFIAIVDIKERTLHFPYQVDTKDEDFSSITNFDTNDSLTGLVVSQRRPILLKKKDLEKRAKQNGVWGPVPLIWMGAPLIVRKEVIGVVAVQSYSNSNLYKEQDLHVLSVVSDQMAVAIDRKHAEDALQASEERLKTIFNASPDPIVVYNNQGHPEYLNAAFTKVFGWHLYELIGQRIPFVPEDQKQITNLKIKELYQSGNPVRFETKRLTKHGKTINVFFSAAKIKDHLKTNSGLVVNLKDITEIRKLEIQVQQSQKMESIGTLAGGIAHDFNNILFPIIGYTEMLLEEFSEKSPLQNSLNKIYTAGLRAKDLVQQILTFARQENSEAQLMKVQPIIKEALKLIRSTIPTTIDIKQDIHPGCGIIKADPTQIHQIIMNLATNANHAMEETGGKLKVSLKEVELGEYDLVNPNMEPGAYVCLTVADTGKGMDKDLIQKIFDPFFTTKEKGRGTGMGLSVVHGIVTGMGGVINVYSEPGIGTQFNVYLPVMEESISARQATDIKTPLQGGSEHILLVDDEKNIVEMEQKMLGRLGYQVTFRTSSIEALELFRANPGRFDLVITDMAMPNMSGDKLSAELLKIRPDTPVLLCTGFSETMSEEKAASLGIKGFLLKPIVMKDLSKKIREVLDKNKAEKK